MTHPEEVRLRYRRGFEQCGWREVQRQVKAGEIWGAKAKEARLWVQEEKGKWWSSFTGRARLAVSILALLLALFWVLWRIFHSATPG